MVVNPYSEIGLIGLETPIREDVVTRLRRQVEAGAYDPPVDELVDRLVHAVIAHHGPSSEDRPE